MSDKLDSLLISCGLRVYRVLLRFYPKRLREVFGAELLGVFHQQTIDAHRTGGFLGLCAVWIQVLFEIPSTVFAVELPWQMMAATGLAVAVSLLEFWAVVAATHIAEIGVM